MLCEDSVNDKNVFQCIEKIKNILNSKNLDKKIIKKKILNQ